MAASDSLGPQFHITPERRAAIEAAMPPVYVGKSPIQATPELRPGNMGKKGRDMRFAARQVAADIMQSTIPPEHLKGIDRIQIGTRLSPGTHAQYNAFVEPDKNGNAHGFIQSTARYDYKHPLTGLAHENRRRDLVHEIGHAQDPRAHVDDGHQGRKEAFAENYADEHLGAVRHAVPVVYDDPKNMALPRRSKLTYAGERHKPSGGLGAQFR